MIDKEKRDAVAIATAFINGKTIQYANPSDGEWKDKQDPPNLRTLVHDVEYYRIKPEEELVPFDYSDAESLIGKVIRINRHSEYLAMIIGVRQDGIETFVSMLNTILNVTDGSNDPKYLTSYQSLLTNYTFLDGSPCGKIKQ